MATLHLTDVPEHVYRQIQEKAETEQRSVSAEAIAILEEALATPSRRLQGQILDELRRLRSLSPAPEEAGVPGSTALLREDREQPAPIHPDVERFSGILPEEDVDDERLYYERLR